MKRARSLLLILCAALAPATGADGGFAYEIELERHHSGTLYLRGGLGDGLETELLLDTGSSYVALSRKTFARLEGQPGVEFLRNIEGTMAAGRRLRVPVYRLPTLTIGTGCVLHDIEVAVMPGRGRDILGLSALRQMQPFALSMDPPRLRFARCAGGSEVALRPRVE